MCHKKLSNWDFLVENHQNNLAKNAKIPPGPAVTGKLLVTTGDAYENGIKSEVIDVLNDDTICEDLPDAPRELGWGQGGMINGSPMVCGGICYGCGDDGKNEIKTCFFLGQNKTVQMKHFRDGSASIAVNHTVRISSI